MRREDEDARSTRAAKTAWLDPDTHRPLMRLKASRGFKSLDRLIRDMLRVYLGLADPDDVGARRKYVELVRRACRELGPETSFYPQLLLRGYRGEITEDLERYVLAHKDEEVFCSLVLGDEENRRRA